MTTEQDVLDLAGKVVAGNENLDRLESAVNDAPGVWTTSTGVSVSNLRRRLAQIGYQVPVAFTSGLVAEDGSFTVTHNGEIYSANPANTPFTTTGTFNSAQWVVSFASTTASDYGLGNDSGPLVDDLDTWYRGGFAYAYGGSHPSATPGDNPFPSLTSLFHLITSSASLGVDDDYIVQTAYYLDVASSVVYESRRVRNNADWSAWVATINADNADNNYHFLSRSAAVTWCTANTPSVGTEISIYAPGVEQGVVRFAYTGSGSHFTESAFDGWVPTGQTMFEHFGAVGDGSTNDAAAILAAATYKNSIGGGIVYGLARKYRINTNITIPRMVTLAGPHEYVGAPGKINGPNDVDYDYMDRAGALLIGSTVTITLLGNSGLTGWFIYRYGITSTPIDDDTAYAGTAITVTEDDPVVRNCMIGGFNRAIDHTNGERGRYADNLIDCVHGIRIDGSQDVTYITRNHCYPFLTLGSVGMSDDLLRSGNAFYVLGADWCHLTDCFSYGYQNGFVVEANSVVFTGCGADNFASAPLAGSNGFFIKSVRGKMIGCQAAAHAGSAVRIENTTGNSFVITQLDVWNATPDLTDNGVFLVSGNLIMSDSSLRRCINGVHVADSASKFTDGGGNNYETCTYEVTIDTTTNTSNIQLQPSMSNKSTGVSRVHVASGSFTLKGVTSAATTALPAEGTYFTVGGVVDIDDLTGGYAGRVVTLVFSGVLTVSNAASSSSKMRLSGGTSFTTSAGATLTLLHNGSYWVEIGRSA